MGRSKIESCIVGQEKEQLCLATSPEVFQGKKTLVNDAVQVSCPDTHGLSPKAPGKLSPLLQVRAASQNQQSKKQCEGDTLGSIR
jgi:hypothetical protein